jgi:hypothetical protein
LETTLSTCLRELVVALEALAAKLVAMVPELLEQPFVLLEPGRDAPIDLAARLNRHDRSGTPCPPPYPA